MKFTYTVQIPVLALLFCGCTTSLDPLQIFHSLKPVLPFGAIETSTVMGQQDWTRNDHLQLQFSQPYDLHVNSDFDDEGSLMAVVDRLNHRVLLYREVLDFDDLSSDEDLESLLTPDRVLGQPHLEENLQYSEVTSATLASPTAITSFDQHILVADSQNHRILIWKGFPTQDMAGAAYSIQSCAEFNHPTDVLITEESGEKALWVTDQQNHRVLRFRFDDFEDFSTEPCPDLVLGQADFASKSPAITPGAQTLRGPTKLDYNGSFFSVTDSQNHRVLLWKGLPKETAQAASLVLGQPDFESVSESENPNSGNLLNPHGVSLNSNVLAVSDLGRNRVLLWKLNEELTSGKRSDSVLGQPDTFSEIANFGEGEGIVHPKGVHNPRGITLLDSKVIAVSDSLNDRILFWKLTGESGTLPLHLLGQADLSSKTVNENTLTAPSRATSNGTRVYVADEENHRVQIWSKIPKNHYEPAAVTLGQLDATQSIYQGATPSSFNKPKMAFSDHSGLYIADSGHHRILIYTTEPEITGLTPADLVLGQPDFTSLTPPIGITADSKLSQPQSVQADHNTIWVTDTGAHRVLGYSKEATLLGESPKASLLLGQTYFFSLAQSTKPEGFSSPEAAYSDGNRLAIADTGNHRVLIYNLPLENQAGALPDLILGQPDLESKSPNQGLEKPGSTTLHSPNSVFIAQDGRLIVTDAGNHRVLIWNEIPDHDGASADWIIGQGSVEEKLSGLTEFWSYFLPNFDEASGLSSISKHGLKAPSGAWAYGEHLFVTDSGNERVLIFDEF